MLKKLTNYCDYHCTFRKQDIKKKNEPKSVSNINVNINLVFKSQEKLFLKDLIKSRELHGYTVYTISIATVIGIAFGTIAHFIWLGNIMI